jgi:hypothetical protein
MKPLLASPLRAGFPMTIFESGTPLAPIWKTAVFGHVEEEVVNKFAQVVYSDAPSKKSLVDKNARLPTRTVVELDVVPIDQAAHSRVHFQIAASAPHARRKPRCDGCEWLLMSANTSRLMEYARA